MNGKKILIVDSDVAVLKDLAHTLNAAGYEVLVANEGAGAISTARGHLPDLILLAEQFPQVPSGGVVWNGSLILESLRASPETSAIPVISTSEDSSIAACNRAREAGFFAFFAKPINIVGLLKVLQMRLFPAGMPIETDILWQSAAA